MSFENAAVTKGLIIFTGVASLLVSVFDVKHYFHLQLVPHISRHHQYWRLLLHHVAFTNSSDFFLSTLLLYNVATQIERQFGSVKYASYAFVSLLVSTLLELVTLLLFHRVGINHMEMGPSALVFSIIYQYSRIVPAMYKYRLFGVELTNKSFNYFIALQLAITRLPASLAVMAIGVFSGQIYRSDIAGLNTYRFSPSVVRFSRKYLAPLIGALRAPKRSNRALPEGSRDGSETPEASQQNDEVVTTARTVPPAPRPATRDLPPEESNAPSVMREWVNELTGSTDQASTGLRVPSDTEVAHVTSMFPSLDRAVVVAALQRSPNIEGAVETLLLAG